MIDENNARLPVYAAYWYDHLVEQNPSIQDLITRQDYIDAVLRWQGAPILITTSGGTC